MFFKFNFINLKREVDAKGVFTFSAFEYIFFKVLQHVFWLNISLKKFLFNNLKEVKSFKNLCLKKVKIFIFTRLKFKGLGFKLKRFGKSLLSFFLGVNDFLYVHLPLGIFCKTRRRKLMFLSLLVITLMLFVGHIFLVRKLNIYFKGFKSKGFQSYRSVRFKKKIKAF